MTDTILNKVSWSMVLNVQDPYPVVPCVHRSSQAPVTGHFTCKPYWWCKFILFLCRSVDYRVELDSYSSSTRCCTSRGSSGKLLRPVQVTRVVPHPVHPVTGQDCAVDTCKAANSIPRRSTSTSTCRFTTQLYPGSQTQYQWYKDRTCDRTTVEIASRLTYNTYPFSYTLW